MKCKLYLLYADNTLLCEEKNYILEGFSASYIKNNTHIEKVIVDNFQVLRPTLDLTIKINKDQLMSFMEKTETPFKYCIIEWIQEINNMEVVESEVKYFIRKINQVAYNTIELEMRMDVLNTFSLNEDGDDYYFYNYCLSPMSVIRRTHKDRIKWRVQNSSFTRIIDKYSEGINADLFKKHDSTLLDTDDEDNTWYLVYRNENQVAGTNDKEVDIVNPVQLLITSDRGYRVSTSSTTHVTKTILPSTISAYYRNNMEEVIFIRDFDKDSSGNNITIIFGGVTYTLVAPTSSYGTNEYSMIIFRHKNNTDNYFINAVGYRFEEDGTTLVSATTLATNLASFEINYCNTGRIQYYLSISAYSALQNLYWNNGNATFGIYSGTSTTTITTNGKKFNDIDLTDPKLVKIINIPYSPFSELNGVYDFTALPENMTWNTELNMIQMVSIPQTMLSWYMNFQSIESNMIYLSIDSEHYTLDIPSNTTRINRKMVYESKLYHSDYFLPKFVYDSFAFNFQLELVDTDKFFETNWDEYYVKFTASKNVVSKFMFTFPNYITTNYGKEDYNNILVIERNNEVALFNNAYMNYMRLGYQFDTKSMERQNQQNILSTALATTGAVASFISSIWTGGAGIVAGVSLGTTAIGGSVRAIQTAQQNDRNLMQKQLQLQNQSTSVSTASDLDLLKEYSGNKAKDVLYGVSDIMKQALYDLFYYNGYATNENAGDTYHLWDLVHSRQLFNFVQADIILRRPLMNKDICDEIVNKWKQGVFFIHNKLFAQVDDGYACWTDPESEYENWEVSVLPVIP